MEEKNDGYEIYRPFVLKLTGIFFNKPLTRIPLGIIGFGVLFLPVRARQKILPGGLIPNRHPLRQSRNQRRPHSQSQGRPRAQARPHY